MKLRALFTLAASALLLFGFAVQSAQAGQKITIAAAADLKFALDEIVVLFGKAHPGDQVETVYGSSGKFQAQIRQGAPFDLYFSADIAYARALKAEGFAASEAQPYAVGRIVLWSPSRDAGRMTLTDLADPAIQKIAIANPKHAPYGKRAEEALKAAGVWEKVEAKLVYGENVAQTAQFVQTGNAQVGIIALSLALSPELAKQGGYTLIPDKLHQPLEQGFIITRHAAGNPLAQAFASFMAGKEARMVMTRYGFALPGEVK
ncbi:MAG: molybdate ABC transporter substrate-binding protein [Gallionella sp.]|nr:molybdate ABC transporter substrate-binding protein [Gallionella sp.]